MVKIPIRKTEPSPSPSLSIHTKLKPSSDFERNHWAHIGEFHTENQFAADPNSRYGIPSLLPTSPQTTPTDLSGSHFSPILLNPDHISSDLPRYSNPFPTQWLRFGFFPHHTSISSLLPTHGVHFFVDDWRFEKAWNQPDYWASRLAPAQLLLSPDFSLYYDWPHAFQIYNVYRSRWLARLWQSVGATVVPTVSWSDPVSFEYAFDGIPLNQPVAVSTLGVSFYPLLQQRYDLGFTTLLERLQPSCIFWYGPDWDTNRTNNQAVLPNFQHAPVPIFYYQLRTTLRWKGSRKGTAGSDPFRLENQSQGLPY